MFCKNSTGGEELSGDDQKSIEWQLWRQKGIGSSDAVILAGHSPWRTIQQLWEDKLGIGVPQETNWAMQRGKDVEPIIRDIYEWEFKCKAPARNVVHSNYPFMKASLDGFVEQTKTVVEIKYPGRKDLEVAMNGQIPQKYFCQLQWQMLCSKADHAHYVSYDGKGKIYVILVGENRKFQRKLTWLAKWFWRKVESRSEIKRYGISLQMPEMSIGKEANRDAW